MDRRQFVHSSFATALGVYLFPRQLFAQEQIDLAIGGGTIHRFSSNEETAPDTPGRIFFVKLSNDSISEQSQDVPFLPHSFSQNLVTKDHVAVCSKWGKTAAVFSMKNQRVVKLLKAENDIRFFGHSVYSSDGKVLYISIQNDRSKMGEIQVRETQGYEIIKTISSNGIYPHDLQLDFDGKTLLIANLGNAQRGLKSNLSWIDPSTSLVVKQIQMDKLPKGGVVHFSNAQSGMFGIGLDNKKSPGFILHLDRKKLVARPITNLQPKLVGESLSVAHSKKLPFYFVTVPLSHAIYKLDSASGKFLGSYSVNYPTAILQVNDRILAVANRTGEIFEYDNSKNGFFAIHKITKPKKMLMGSHMTQILG